jgi:hypothetical protein
MNDTAQRCIEFARACLDPEQYGHAVEPYVRDAARRALGMEPVETQRLRVYSTCEPERLGPDAWAPARPE